MTQPPGNPGRPPYGDHPYDDDPYGRSGSYGHAEPEPADPYGQPSRDWFGRPSQPPPPDPYRDHGRPQDYGRPGDYGPPPGPDYGPPPGSGYGPPQGNDYGPPPGDNYGPPRVPGQPGPRHGIPSQPSPGQPFPGQPGPDDLAGQDFPTTEFRFPPVGDPAGPHERAQYQPSYQQQPYDPPFDPHRTPTRSRAGVIFAVVGGLLVLALLGIGGFVLLGAGSAGDNAGAGTTTSAAGADTAAPATVVDSWLTAMFVDKSAEGMLKHTCKKESERKEIDDAIRAVKKAEQDADDAGLGFTISWSDPKEISKTTEKATVETTLSVKVGDKTEKKNTKLDLVYEAGWKVCDAQMS